ncbi:MAG TPA: PTS transporter subunit EIIC [Actinocrinis sp.]|nr:PTS transporter subunit EIIC [Actinocrinis sp.]
MSSADPPGADAGRRASWGRVLAVLQRIGRSLMLPIATLPAAALLTRFGQPDMLGGWDFAAGAPLPGINGLHLATHWHWLQHVADVLSAAGGVLFANLPFIFTVGVAVGFAKKADGSTGLAAVVGYLVYNEVSMTMFGGSSIRAQVGTSVGGVYMLNFLAPNPTGVLGGICMGIITALTFQRFYRTKLPTYLAFFGGRRMVPILTSVFGLVFGVLMGWVWAPIGDAINSSGTWMTGHGVLGSFVYGVANRLLLPFGLHHIVNTVAWFQFGTYTNPLTHATVHGDIPRFFAGDPTAGTFMTGFFPVMMFGLPGAAIAMWRSALPEKQKVAGGILLSAAFCSFLTGVTEPIEFAFMFVAPALFLVHALLTGASLALMNALGCHDGFGFSAGAIDYALNWTLATKPWLILIAGPAYFVLYFVLFTVCIRVFNLPTPGRETDGEAATSVLPDPTAA